MSITTYERRCNTQYQCCNVRTTSVPKVHFNARDCTPLATCLEKHALFVFPYVRKGVHERVLQERTTKSSWNSALLSGKLCGFGTLHKVRSIKAHVLSCLPWFLNKSNVWFLRCLLNTHNECAMHVHNHPRVVAHDVKHEYIRVCCVLWGFPYVHTIIQHV